jgi:hypothetical protein
MTGFIPLVAALLSSGSVAATPAEPSAALSAATQQDFRWSGHIARGETLQIKGIIGDIRAEASSGDEVLVTAEKSGSNTSRVHVQMVRRGGGVVICAIYDGDDDDDGDSYRSRGARHRDRDGDDDDEPRDACNPGTNHSIHGNAPSVDFTVRVPAGVRLVARSVTGDVYARGLHSPVDAASVSGSVTVSSDGPVEARSVSGDVEATLGRTGGQNLEFGSVSGDVTLRMPEGVDADFSARTLSGEIDSDFPLTVGNGRGRGRDRDDDDDDDGDSHGVRVRVRIGQHAEGRLGRGGPDISVNTVSGNITLRRLRR